MDRFTEQTTFTNAALAHRMGDDDAPSYEELPLCGSCGSEALELTPAAWDKTLHVGACCAAGGEEPACECVSDGGDLFHPGDCEIHNASSPWNARISAIREDAVATRLENKEVA